MNETGGPAFPAHPVMGQISAPGLGMSLRDFFAAKAMQAMLTQSRPCPERARDAYTMADAMLKARNAG